MVDASAEPNGTNASNVESSDQNEDDQEEIVTVDDDSPEFFAPDEQEGERNLFDFIDAIVEKL